MTTIINYLIMNDSVPYISSINLCDKKGYFNCSLPMIIWTFLTIFWINLTREKILSLHICIYVYITISTDDVLNILVYENIFWLGDRVSVVLFNLRITYVESSSYRTGTWATTSVDLRWVNDSDCNIFTIVDNYISI